MFCADQICEACDQFTLTIESELPITGMYDLPNTYDPHENNYAWKYDEIMGYVLIPRAFHGNTAVLDLYLCIDDRDRGTIDVCGYAEKFLITKVFPESNSFRIARLAGPAAATPENIPCRRNKLIRKENFQ